MRNNRHSNICHAVTPYFAFLSEGGSVNDLQTLKNELGSVLKNASPSNRILNFWIAARALNMKPDLAQRAMTKSQLAKNALKEQMKMDGNYLLFSAIHRLESSIDEPAVVAEDLSKLLHAHVLLQTAPSAPMMSKILRKLETAFDKKSLATECLIRFPKMLSELGVYPGDEWVEKWWKNTQPKLDNLIRDECYSLLYHVTLLDFLRKKDHGIDEQHPSPCRKIGQSFLEVIEDNASYFFPDRMDRRIFFAAKWFGADFVDQFPIQAETNYVSNAEKSFAQCLKKRNIVVDREGIFIPRTGHRVDLRLADEQHGAEYDGLTHFNRVTMTEAFGRAVAYNTSTRFQSQINADHGEGLRILRVPYFYGQWPASTSQPWEEAIDRLAQQVAGVYAYHGKGNIKNMEEKDAHLFPKISL